MNMKKHIFVIAVLISAVSICVGFRTHKSYVDIRDTDSLRIEFVGSKDKKVEIKKIRRSQGFVFLAKEKVAFSEGEYIKVTNKRTGVSFYVSQKGFKLTGTSNVSAYIKKRHAAGKGKSDFGAILQSYPWQMVNDTLRIPTVMQIDDDHGFILRTINDNMELKVPFDTVTNELVLTKDYFLDNHIQLIENNDYIFLVEYWDHNNFEAITDRFIIQYIPVIK